MSSVNEIERIRQLRKDLERYAIEYYVHDQPTAGLKTDPVCCIRLLHPFHRNAAEARKSIRND